MNKGEKLIAKNAMDFITGKHDGRLIYRDTVEKKVKGKCPRCGKHTLYHIYGLGGMGIGQDIQCECGYSQLHEEVKCLIN